MKIIYYRDVFTGLFYCHSTDPNIINEYGQGSTKESALQSLKIRLNQIKFKYEIRYF